MVLSYFTHILFIETDKIIFFPYSLNATYNILACGNIIGKRLCTKRKISLNRFILRHVNSIECLIYSLLAVIVLWKCRPPKVFLFYCCDSNTTKSTMTQKTHLLRIIVKIRAELIFFYIRIVSHGNNTEDKFGFVT